MTERQVGLRKRTRPFTPVPNETVDDFTIGYRELGLLTRILRMPDGFVIRSEQLANEGKGKTLRGRKPDREGREAVRTALRNLAKAGYYRLGRLRYQDGTFAMVTDVGEDPDQSWADQAAIFEGKPVPMYEQPDGTFTVKYPDGTSLADGFPPPSGAMTSEKDAEDEEAKGGETPKTGFRAPVSRTPTNLASGDAGTGEGSSLSKRVIGDGHKDSVPASQVRPGGGRSGSAVQTTIDGDEEIAGPKEPTEEERSFGIARGWIEYREKEHKPIAGRNVLHRLRALVQQFLAAGYDDDEVKRALNGLGEGIPSTGQMQRALGTIRERKTPGANGRAVTRGAGARVNEHWDREEQNNDSAAAPAPRKAAAVQTTGAFW